MTWVRSGTCNRCGACCLAGGDPAVNNPVFTVADLAGRRVSDHCPLLAPRAGEVGWDCRGHGAHPYHLGGCISFPTRPQDIADVLAYRERVGARA